MGEKTNSILKSIFTTKRKSTRTVLELNAGTRTVLVLYYEPIF